MTCRACGELNRDAAPKRFAAAPVRMSSTLGRVHLVKAG
jgi:hypothetical protein